MKTVRMLVVLIAVAFMLPLTISAQQPGNPPQMVTQTVTGPATYKVVEGDSVAGLSPDSWQRIEAANAFLQPASRHFVVAATGGPGLKIYPDEVLTIPAGVTITFRHPAPGSLVTPSSVPTIITPVNNGLTTADVSAAIAAALKPLWWLLGLLTLLLLALLGYLIYQMARMRQENRERGIEDATSHMMHAMLMSMIVDRIEYVSRRVNQMFARLIYETFHIRRDVQRVHLEVLETRLDVEHLGQRPGFELVDLEVMFGETHHAPTMTNQGPLAGHRGHTGRVDFVEINRGDEFGRMTGERFSFEVTHGSNVRPQDNGVAVEGSVVMLDEEAAHRRRDEATMARRERNLADQRDAAVFG